MSGLRDGRGDPFTISSGVALVDGETTFAAHTTDPDGDPLLYEWDLDGDGAFELSRSTPRNADSDGRVRVRRFYRRPGAARIRLRVSDFPGLPRSTSHERPGEGFGAPGEVTVEKELSIIDRDANSPPRAAFTLNPSTVTVGSPAVFDAAGSSDPDPWDNPDRYPGALRYEWHFGDIVKGANTGRRTEHSYAAPGERTVTLTVTHFVGAQHVARADGDGPPVRGPELLADGTLYGQARPARLWPLDQVRRVVVERPRGPDRTVLVGSRG
jgi:hypothetical protein